MTPRLLLHPVPVWAEQGRRAHLVKPLALFRSLPSP
jgi:hypothetical protein